jgi:predicted RNA-binding Zn-ribbon protein involved in translation (DUF1610 family)
MIKENKEYVCKSCMMIKRNKSATTINCPNCGVKLTSENEVRYGKRGNRNSSLCKPCYKLNWKKEYQEIKRKVMEHYGGKCACCGEHRLEFLTIDHVNNDGGKHRREQAHSLGTGLYKLLLRKNFDLGYELQVLCWNCNEAKNYYGICPHEVERNSNLLNRQ